MMAAALDVGFVTALTLVAAACGLRALRWADLVPREAKDRLALAVPTGLGLLALAVLALGEVGLLGGWWLAVLLLGMACLGDRRGVRAGLAGLGAAVFGPRSALDATMDLLAAAVLAGSFLTALLPVTDGDALCYHLQVPKVFLQAGAVGFEPDLHETVYPLVTELLFLVALAFRGPVACRLMSFVLGVSFVGCVTALARPYLGRRTRWAGTIALLVPAVSNGMSAPLNDVALASYATAALVAWLSYRDGPCPRRALGAGFLGGLALGVKYPALVWVGLLGGIAVAADLLRWRRARLEPWLYAAGVLTAGGWWYLRAFAATGNPVYPFYRDTFGAGIGEVLEPIKRPLEVTAWNLLTALGPMTLDPDRFDSFSHQFGPVFLLFLPGLLLYRPPRRLVGIVALGMLFLTICLTQRQSMRFVLPVVGPMACGVAWVLSAVHGRWAVGGAQRLLVGAMVACLVFEAGIGLGRARHGLGVFLGREGAEAFLARREPSVVVGQWMARNLPGSARVIGQDHRGFYLPRPYTMEKAHRRRTGLGRGGESADAIVATLRERGFTHVMLCPPIPEDAVEFDPTLGRLLAGWVAGRVPLYRQRLADGDGVVREYAIYKLSTDEPGTRRVASAPGGGRG